MIRLVGQQRLDEHDREAQRDVDPDTRDRSRRAQFLEACEANPLGREGDDADSHGQPEGGAIVP